MQGGDVVVVGAGMAGLATAWQLSQRGARVLVVEQEVLPGMHASGRNAAIFRSVDRYGDTAALAARTQELMVELGVAQALNPVGLMLLGAPKDLTALAPSMGHLGADDIQVCAPMTRDSPYQAGLWAPADGVLDVNAIMAALQRELRDKGGRLHLQTPVTLVKTALGWRVQCKDGSVLEGDELVLAAGAWSHSLGQSAGLGLPLRALGRHLMQLSLPQPVPPGHPVVWAVGPQELYFRPESHGVLASPCDEVEGRAGDVPVDPAASLRLAQGLSAVFPALAQACVRRVWTCQRTFSARGEFVLGRDPRAGHVTWVTGLGGRGMTCGLALGELAAKVVLGMAAAPEHMQPAGLLLDC